MEEIKVESNASLVCHGCLSRGRHTATLGALTDSFLNIIGSQKQSMVYGIEDIKLCWECVALLNKFKTFQTQLKDAQNFLMQMFYDLDYQPPSLSKLSILKKDHYDHNYEYEESKKKKKDSKQTKNLNTKTENIEHKNLLELETLNSIKEEACEDFEYFDDDITEHKFDISNVDENNDLTVMTHIENYHDLNNTINSLEKPQWESTTKNNEVDGKQNSEDHVSSYYRQFTNIIKQEKIDWGNTEAYFTELHFSEQEMDEQYFKIHNSYYPLSKLQYQCVACDKHYFIKCDLLRHNDLNHNKTKNFKCSKCGEAQKTLEALTDHWRDIHTLLYKCNLCGELCRARGRRKHLNSYHTHKYSCKFCNMRFGTIVNFKQHYKSMHQNFICDYCSTSCKSRTLVEKHIKSFHIEVKCKECGRRFANRHQYMRHRVEAHPTRDLEHPELSYCVECDKQYPNVYKYKRHLKISPKHIEIKRVVIPCPDCGKLFRRKNYLNNHYNLYHTKKTKHYCEICDKYYANSYGLKTHRMHIHMKLSPVKDKMCDLCGRGFSTNRILMNHRRTHTGERPYQCPYCTAAFTQKQAMHSHCRTQHKDIKLPNT